MTLESDLIRRYRGAFSPEDCEECIKYIDQFDSNNILTYDTEKLNEVDNKTINLTHSYNLASYSYLADLILPKFIAESIHRAISPPPSMCCNGTVGKVIS